MNIKIIVATHKRYRMPEDTMYLPVHVGRQGKDDIGYVGDDTGDNISDRNSFFYEMTAVYWTWKNINADVIGICHYRRYFSVRSLIQYKIRGKWDSILSYSQIEDIIKTSDVITPNKRRYLIQSNKSHYSCSHDPNELEILRTLIRSKCPKYEYGYDLVLNRTWAHMFNMYIMKKELFDAFCEWMFDLLFEFENMVNVTEQGAWIAELMLDTWLETNKLKYEELPVMFMEKQNWINKGGAMVLRRIKGIIKGF